MELIDALYMKHPFLGSRRMVLMLDRNHGYKINRKRVQRLMRKMGIEAIHPKPRLSRPEPGHKIYPYLLRNLAITYANQVWCADITYIPMPNGFMYLVVIMDWYSRYVLSWRLSNTLDATFCIDALNEALSQAKPTIFNTDQGVQFTSADFTSILSDAQIGISMDDRGRYLDNIFIERLWRTVKYEDIYIWRYEFVPDLELGLYRYFNFYNVERPHFSLNDFSPAQIYHGTATI
jgi:putative transposase